MPRCLIVLLTGVFFAASIAQGDETPPAAWNPITREAKPWTRWWWPGNAVDKANLTRELEQFAQAGLGGVEITPIYGARGYENRYIKFLSPRWIDMLDHTGREAQRLGLGVDLATGTGWPFGGPWITEADALEKIIFADGKLSGAPTGMKVKRAAPGGEGLVLDPYSTAAMQHYLAPFSAAFANFPREFVRAQFHDSFEYYDASWSPALPAVFRGMHGYDLQSFAAELVGKKAIDPVALGRIKSDYRETLAQMHFAYLREWLRWSHDHGWIVRNQSHGAPANLLDLYGAVDIPETEVFGSTPFPIPGLRRDPADVRSDQDLPEPLVIRMASSAAHVMGHRLVSSETCTWLREHWKVSLAFTKPEIDRLFVCGINHIFYHGTVYSPEDAPWPGWLFYASTEFYPTNSWWDDFPALNAYAARVQSILQSGHPDNDLLLYWPFDDALDSPDGLMKQFTVHDVAWLRDSPTGKLAAKFSAQGYSFDYISDEQLRQTHAEAGTLVTPGNRYRALVVPATRRMPLATLVQILALARSGATVIFESLPEDVPGFGELEERREKFKTLRASFAATSSLVNADVLAALRDRPVPREPMVETGIRFVRRTRTAGSGDHDYFLVNLTGKNFAGWVPLGVHASSVRICDPLTGQTGLAALRHFPRDSAAVDGAPTSREGTTGRTAGTPPAEPVTRDEIYFQLAAGESLILRTTEAAPAASDVRWNYLTPAGAAVVLNGTWKIEFIKGGPELPPALETTSLKSWTDLGGDEAKRFAGTARYRLEFDAPTTRADDWLIDLGDVRESARVRLNGVEIATAWSLPFHVRIGPRLKPGRNVLELEVTNLAANRIRDLDRRGVSWKIMREINFVNINYRPFDASNWPLTPSGLLGPVTLTPLRLSPSPML